MSAHSHPRTIALRDGARVTLRPITPEDKPLLAASFERLSEESRYRRFFTTKNKLSAAELEYFVDVDHIDHEAIIAIDPVGGAGLGIARYIRSGNDAEVAEVAIVVADDWQGRGLGRALLDRLTARARQAGVRRFSAVVQSDNRASLGLLESVGDTRRRSDTAEVELVIKLPPQRGTGVRLVRALQAAAAGSLLPARTLAHRVAVGVRTSPRSPPQPGWPIRTIVVGVVGVDHADHVDGVDGPSHGSRSLAAAQQLAAVLGASLHIVSAYDAPRARSQAERALTAAAQAARAEGLEAVTHACHEGAAEALIAVAEKQHADLLVVGRAGMARAGGSVSDQVSHHPPCSILIIRADE